MCGSVLIVKLFVFATVCPYVHNKDCFEMNVPHKLSFYNHIWLFFCHMYAHCSQKWGSDGHFEVFHGTKLWLVQKLWHKTQIFPFLFFCNLLQKPETNRETFGTSFSAGLKHIYLKNSLFFWQTLPALLMFAFIMCCTTALFKNNRRAHQENTDYLK